MIDESATGSTDPATMTAPTDPEPATGTGPGTHAVPGTDAAPDTETVTYTPAPIRRPEWASPDWQAVDHSDRTPDPSRAPATEPVPAPAVRPAARSAGVGTVIGAALLSAVLASGGTVLLLGSSGALDRLGPGPTGSTPQSSRGPVAIDESSAVVAAAANVSPAVVRITATGVSTDVFGGTLPETGIGSGVIYDAEGWILTNRHVVLTQEDAIASSLTVELKDGRQFTGTVYGIDTLTDLAIVKVDATGLPWATMGRSADIKVGQLAIAIGSPLGTYTSTVTTGIISATGRSINVSSDTRLTNLIQTDAAINPGNSGGPLLDAAGAVIGINTAVERDSTGIGFAIPIDIARPIMSQALAGEPLARPDVGIRYQQIDAKLKRQKSLSVDQGALVGPATDAAGQVLPAIAPDSPAEKAGLKDGDIIVSIEGQTIDAEHPLDALLTSYSPGQSVEMRVLRGSEQLTVTITLGTRPDNL
jgi:S1-C subfamily serine protease